MAKRKQSGIKKGLTKGKSKSILMKNRKLKEEYKLLQESKLKGKLKKKVAMEAKKKTVELPDTYLTVVGFGKDTNGQGIIKLKKGDERGFNIQTSQNLPKTHRLKTSGTKVTDLTEAELKDIAKEVIEYVSEFGSKKMKSGLMTEACEGESGGGSDVVEESEKLATETSVDVDPNKKTVTLYQKDEFGDVGERNMIELSYEDVEMLKGMLGEENDDVVTEETVTESTSDLTFEYTFTPETTKRTAKTDIIVFRDGEYLDSYEVTGEITDYTKGRIEKQIRKEYAVVEETINETESTHSIILPNTNIELVGFYTDPSTKKGMVTIKNKDGEDYSTTIDDRMVGVQKFFNDGVDVSDLTESELEEVSRNVVDFINIFGTQTIKDMFSGAIENTINEGVSGEAVDIIYDMVDQGTSPENLFIMLGIGMGSQFRDEFLEEINHKTGNDIEDFYDIPTDEGIGAKPAFDWIVKWMSNEDIYNILDAEELTPRFSEDGEESDPLDDFDIDDARVYVGTYNKYNAGSLGGEWVALSDYESVEDFYTYAKKLHSDEEDPEYMFQDWEGIPDGFISQDTIESRLWTYLLEEAVADDVSVDRNGKEFKLDHSLEVIDKEKEYYDFFKGFEEYIISEYPNKQAMLNDHLYMYKGDNGFDVMKDLKEYMTSWMADYMFLVLYPDKNAETINEALGDTVYNATEIEELIKSLIKSDEVYKVNLAKVGFKEGDFNVVQAHTNRTTVDNPYGYETSMSADGGRHYIFVADETVTDELMDTLNNYTHGDDFDESFESVFDSFVVGKTFTDELGNTVNVLEFKEEMVSDLNGGYTMEQIIDMYAFDIVSEEGCTKDDKDLVSEEIDEDKYADAVNTVIQDLKDSNLLDQDASEEEIEKWIGADGVKNMIDGVYYGTAYKNEEGQWVDIPVFSKPDKEPISDEQKETISNYFDGIVSRKDFYVDGELIDISEWKEEIIDVYYKYGDRSFDVVFDDFGFDVKDKDGVVSEDVVTEAKGEFTDEILTELEEFTEYNDHAGYLVKVAETTGSKYYTDIFRAIKEIRDADRGMPSQLSDYSYEKSQELFKYLEKEYGADVYKKVYATG